MRRTSYRPARSRRWLGVIASALLLPIALGHVEANSAEDNGAMTDQAITDKIDEELLVDPGVLSFKIDVNTSDGIVTLTGVVNNLLARDRAARISKTVKGVRAVVNRIKVVPSLVREDSALAADIRSALRDDPVAEAYEIDVTVDDRVVTLDGRVDSYQEHALVLRLVKGVAGIRDINDQVTVFYKSDRSDAELRAEIEQALRWNVYVDDNLINVAVINGNVSLSGVVGSAAEKVRAETLAWVAGVESVDADKLVVERWARDDALRGDKYAHRSEDELRRAVARALRADPRVASFNVDVDVTGDVVTLRGIVENLQAKRAAGQDARNTVRVSYVNNRIKVRPEETRAADEIAADIRTRFKRDAYLERFEVMPVVIDGVAYLYGTVDSAFEKSRADHLASRVQGVMEVKNRLDVEADATYIYDPRVDEGVVSDQDIAGTRTPTTETDAQVQQAIESELWWSPFVDSDDVQVTVDGGTARLTGTVDSWSELHAATRNAYQGGANAVDNDLLIRDL